MLLFMIFWKVFLLINFFLMKLVVEKIIVWILCMLVIKWVK